MSMRRRMGTATVMLVGTTMLVSCAVGPAASDGPTTTVVPRSGGQLSVGIENDLNGLDPTRNAWDPVSLQVANALYDTLFAYDANGIPQPYALAAAEHSADYRHWTLRLRPGLQFHNGRVATADDLTRNIRAYRDSFITGQGAENIIDASTVDELTTRVDMKRPWANYPAILTGQGGTLVASWQLDDPYGHSHPVGTGPFKLQAWHQGEQLAVTRNPDYWRTDAFGTRLPYLDSVTFKVVPDQDREREMLTAGELDAYQTRLGTATSPLDELAKQGNIFVEHDPGATETSFIMFNTAKAPLNDIRIRQAMAYALDLDALARQFDWPRDRLTNTPIPPSSPFHDAGVAFPRADTARARQLVEAYRRETGVAPKVAMSVATQVDVARALTAAWTAVGIETDISIITVEQVVLHGVTGNYDTMLLAFYASTDVDTLYGFWHSNSVRPIGQIGLNYTRFADAQIDKALDDGRASAEPAVRREAYRRLQARFAETVPLIWLGRLDWIIARAPYVHNARNVTLPDGQDAAPYESGVFRLTETWLGT